MCPANLGMRRWRGWWGLAEGSDSNGRLGKICIYFGVEMGGNGLQWLGLQSLYIAFVVINCT